MSQKNVKNVEKETQNKVFYITREKFWMTNYYYYHDYYSYTYCYRIKEYEKITNVLFLISSIGSESEVNFIFIANAH